MKEKVIRVIERSCLVIFIFAIVTVLAFSALMAIGIVSDDRRADRLEPPRTLTVTDHASRNVLADRVTIEGGFGVTVPAGDGARAQEIAERDTELIREFFVGCGIAEQDIMFTDNSYNSGLLSNDSYEHAIMRGFFIETDDVVLVDSRSRWVSAMGVGNVKIPPEHYYAVASAREALRMARFALSCPYFHYSDIEGLRQSLIEAATQDAWTTAAYETELLGASLGNLLNTKIGLFEMNPRDNGYDRPDKYNIAHLRTRFKTGSITVDLTFELK